MHNFNSYAFTPKHVLDISTPMPRHHSQTVAGRSLRVENPKKIDKWRTVWVWKVRLAFIWFTFNSRSVPFRSVHSFHCNFVYSHGPVYVHVLCAMSMSYAHWSVASTHSHRCDTQPSTDDVCHRPRKPTTTISSGTFAEWTRPEHMVNRICGCEV